MKKFFNLIMVMAFVLALTVPAMAQPLYVTGDVFQQNVGNILKSLPSGNGSAQATGGQGGIASFFANPVGQSGENASGSAASNGSTLVTASVTKGNSQAYGYTGNAGNVNVSQSPVGSGPIGCMLEGDGLMLTSTFSATHGKDLNGAVGQTLTHGTFLYSASGGPGWTGYGSTVNAGLSTTGKVPNGFSAFSSASVTSVACPK